MKTWLVLLSALLWVSSANMVHAGNNVWTNIGLNEGREITALALDPTTPTTLYAGTGGGVYKSTTGGSSWSVSNTGLTNTDVRALALDPTTPTTLYAGTDGGGVFAITFGPSGPSLALFVNQPSVHRGDTLTLTAMATPGPTPVTADVYIALAPPGCSALPCLLFWQGGLNFTATPQLLGRNWLISPVNASIFSYPFSGNEPVGNYIWLGAFTVPGTGDLIGAITQAPFTFTP